MYGEGGVSPAKNGLGSEGSSSEGKGCLWLTEELGLIVSQHAPLSTPALNGGQG